MFDIELYKPLTCFDDVKHLPKYVLEIWYGKMGTELFKMIDNTEIKYNLNEYPNRVYYFKDNNPLLCYKTDVKIILINDALIWRKFINTYKIEDKIISQSLISFLQSYYKFEINKVWFTSFSLSLIEYFNREKL